MATIRNNKENQFSFHVDGVEYVIPAGKQGEKGFEPSTTTIDDAVMKEAVKQPVIAAWIESDAIDVAAAPKAPAAAAKPAAQ